MIWPISHADIGFFGTRNRPFLVAETGKPRGGYLLAVDGGAFLEHAAYNLYDALLAQEKFFTRQFLDGVVKSKSLNLCPIIIAFKELPVPLVYQCSVTSFSHNGKVTKKPRKHHCLRGFFTFYVFYPFPFSLFVTSCRSSARPSSIRRSPDCASRSSSSPRCAAPRWPP